MAERQPDILLIILDTLRRDRLSAYGHGRETSPAFDAFAADATCFERAVAPAQWTVPAHASLFTGLYPGQHRLTQASGVLSGLHPTLAEILRGAGYHTVAFCNNPLLGVLNHGLQRGFDAFYNYASVIPQRPDSVRRSRLRDLFDRRFRPYARRIGNGFARHDTLFRLALTPAFVPIWSRAINLKGNTAASVSDLLDYWSAYRAGGQSAPLFAFLNLMGAHLPYRPPEDALSRVAPRLRHDRHARRFVRRFNADAAAWASPDDPPLAEWQRRALLDFYDAEIAEQDRHLGRLLTGLKSAGALDNALVIVVADHGEGHGEHAMFGHGFIANQELVHVPLAIAGAGPFARGKRVATTVSTRRIFHTILDVASVQPPLDASDPNANVHGLSLCRALDETPGPEHDLAFSEAVPTTTFLSVLEHRNPASIERLRLRLTRRAIYEGPSKLTAVGESMDALYDVASDPAETTDLKASQPDRAAALFERLLAFARGHDDATLAGEQADFSPAVEAHLRALGYID